MKNIINRFLNNSILKNIGTLVTGVVIGQIIVFCSQFILRRIFTIEDFGAFDVYLSVFNIVVVTITLRYENAIILPKYDKVAVNLVAVSFLFSLFFSALFFIIIVFFNDFTISFFNFSERYKNWIYFLPFTILFYSLYNIINYWLIRKERYKASSLNKVIRRTGESFTQISVGYFGKNIGLVIGDLLGNILNFLYGLILLINSKFPFNQIKIRLTIYAVKKYKQFPIYNLIPYLLEAVSYSIPIFAVNSIFSETEVGFLNLTRQVLIMPSVLIAIAISLVLYKKTTELYINKKSVKKELINIFKPLLVVIFFEIVILLLFGESLFKILFGNKWQLSGYISKILVFGFISSFIVNPFAVMLWVLNKLKIQAIWQIINFFIIGSLFFFKDLSFINFVKLYSVFLVISYLMYGIIIFRVINKYEQSLRNKM